MPKEVKIGTPAGFSGKKSELDNFIFEMRHYIDCVNLGDGEDACRFVATHLKGSALTWWRSYSKNGFAVY